MRKRTELSKLLSWALRHQPAELDLALDAGGWVDVTSLLDALVRHGVDIDLTELRVIVSSDDKQRYAFSEDGERIRAQQGHSVTITLDYEAREPPEELYHGTVARFVDRISRQGLLRGNRHHVHLSATRGGAESVGKRRGKALVLVVRARALHATGVRFFRTPNGVWLTEHVPARYLVIPSATDEA